MSLYEKHLEQYIWKTLLLTAYSSQLHKDRNQVAFVKHCLTSISFYATHETNNIYKTSKI